ncbi:MAG: bifunctional phosphoglucose/phosphomannose isomerase [Candidatus Rokuibacteriota bacterium]
MLDDLATLDRLDRQGTRRVLAEFPAQCRRARALPVAPPPSGRRPRLVVLAGMGGSAASGDVLAACGLDRVDVPIVVHRDYGLPAAVGRDALVIASSYSGETEEVLSATETAIARGVPVVAITSGGALAGLAAAHDLARVVLPAGLMPRMALGYLLLPAVAALRACDVEVASAADEDEAIEALQALGDSLSAERPAADNQAKRIALEIGARLPVVYGAGGVAAVAYRWKTDLEEFAKTFALAGTVPEINHNEIEAWRIPDGRGLHLVLLRDPAESPEIARRYALMRELVAPAAGGLSEAWARGRSRLTRLLSLTYLGQWVAYYLAVLRGVDPWTVPLLDEMKRRLRDGSP